VRLAALAGAPLPGSLAALRAWAADGRSPAAALLAQAFATSPPHAAAPPRLLPALEAPWFLARQGEAELSLAPLFEGAPAETGALSRQQRHPTVHEALAAHGPGALARLVARLAEVSALPQQLRALAAELAPCAPAGPQAQLTGSGAGVVETSRGLLAHVVSLERGAVVRWRTVAPTEWNFHPQGPLAQALLGLPAEGLAQRAALAVSALDPCVGYEVRIRG
jgi:Ni,Fe-hydrogenase I large subunit